MKVLIAPLEFKGTLTARQAAEAVARGVRTARPGWELDLLPLSDGGPGMVDAVLAATAGATSHPAEVHDPLGRPIRASWAALPDGTAVIEMAAASGLARLTPSERDPLRTSTFGTGELVCQALHAGHRRILVGAGGSATNDGGAGALAALGCLLRDASGAEVERGGGGLASAFTLDRTRLRPELQGAELIVATDVTAPLLGPQGATRVFGPQKGASPAVVEALEHALCRFADLVAAAMGRDLRAEAGMGAAGGLAFGLAAVLGARIAPGFELISELCGLRARLQRADVILTGEGRLDAQTAMGKGPARLAQRAGRHRTVALVGAVARADATLDGLFRSVEVVTPPGVADEVLERQAAAFLEDGARRWAESYRR